ncbi:Septum formation initiator [metagenome]|uniref:Septum formation initiator n=1 Tax=metagenome TaxID=256318 RepID=A0A2P2C329_9ZZZZ
MSDPRRPSRRPASRPGARGVARPRSSAGSPPAPGTPRASAPRPRLTGRAAILILLVAVLTVSYASSMRAYLQQRAHIGELKAEIAQRSANIDDLEREKRRWSDAAFLEQQARERFGFAYPGETVYTVTENGKPLDGADALHEPSDVVRKTPTAWWSTAWASVEEAGDPSSAPAGPAAP